MSRASRVNRIQDFGGTTCICGHLSSHHFPPAIGHRACERVGCSCALYTDADGRKAWFRYTTVTMSADELGRVPTDTDITVTDRGGDGTVAYLDFLEMAFGDKPYRHMRMSIEHQQYLIALRAQEAIERLTGMYR